MTAAPDLAPPGKCPGCDAYRGQVRGPRGKLCDRCAQVVARSREAEALVAGWAAGGRVAAAADLAAHHRALYGLPDPPPRPPHLLAEWPNFDFAGLTWNRPPCDCCGGRAFARYGARRADERIHDSEIAYRTVPLCSSCKEGKGDGLVAWLVERTCAG